MSRFLKSFGWAANGLKAVWIEERNFRIEVIIGIVAVVLGFYRDFADWQWVFFGTHHRLCSNG